MSLCSLASNGDAYHWSLILLIRSIDKPLAQRISTVLIFVHDKLLLLGPQSKKICWFHYVFAKSQGNIKTFPTLLSNTSLVFPLCLLLPNIDSLVKLSSNVLSAASWSIPRQRKGNKMGGEEVALPFTTTFMPFDPSYRKRYHDIKDE